jgi:hypothetical protein
MGSSTGVIYLFTPLLRLGILRDYNDHNKIPLRKQVSRDLSANPGPLTSR